MSNKISINTKDFEKIFEHWEELKLNNSKISKLANTDNYELIPKENIIGTNFNIETYVESTTGKTFKQLYQDIDNLIINLNNYVSKIKKSDNANPTIKPTQAIGTINGITGSINNTIINGNNGNNTIIGSNTNNIINGNNSNNIITGNNNNNTINGNNGNNIITGSNNNNNNNIINGSNVNNTISGNNGNNFTGNKPNNAIIGNFENNNSNINIEKHYGKLNINKDNVLIVDANGNPIGLAEGNQYIVYETKTDANGNIIAVRISKDGEPEQWIYLEQNGHIIGSYYEYNQIGNFTYDSNNLPIYDKNGNIIGILPNGQYKIYDSITDASGNIIAIRISKDGEPEQWLHIYENGKYIGQYESNGVIYSNNNIIIEDKNNNKLTLFTTKNKVLGGLLGILVVALGTTMYIKNKQGKKIQEEVPEGEYNIYEYNQDDNGNITEARITDDNTEEQQWIQF